jgi:hypothetical protein
MKKFSVFIVLILLVIIGSIFAINTKSYSFIKDFFNSNPREIKENVIEEKNIDGIEDLIFIPGIKNFKKIFLNDMNNEKLIEVKIPENILYFYNYNPKTKAKKLIRKYPVAVGRITRQTPIGEGIVYTKGNIVFKRQYGPRAGTVIEKGHTKEGEEFDMPYDKMYGLYMVLNQSDSYVIHSTTEDWRIGYAVSGGCVRMLIPDMQELFPLVDPPVKVKVIYELFKINNGMLTVYPDIYRRNYSLYSALIEFFNEKKINPVIFDQDKIRKSLFRQLPVSIDLNDVLHDYFISLDLTYDEIKIKYKELLENNRITKLDEFFVKGN